MFRLGTHFFMGCYSLAAWTAHATFPQLPETKWWEMSRKSFYVLVVKRLFSHLQIFSALSPLFLFGWLFFFFFFFCSLSCSFIYCSFSFTEFRNKTITTKATFSFTEPTILLACGRDRELSIHVTAGQRDRGLLGRERSARMLYNLYN